MTNQIMCPKIPAGNIVSTRSEPKHVKESWYITIQLGSKKTLQNRGPTSKTIAICEPTCRTSAQHE